MHKGWGDIVAACLLQTWSNTAAIQPSLVWLLVLVPVPFEKMSTRKAAIAINKAPGGDDPTTQAAPEACVIMYGARLITSMWL
jgi:hypothetical protein